MANGAGELTHSVAFELRADASDGAGGVEAGFSEHFRASAAYVHLRGGEAVIAGRLAGQHPVVIRVRASTEARQVTAAWRLRDTRTGEVFNIRDVTRTEDRMWIEFLCQSGVAT